MENYFSELFTTHLKYWYIYLLSIIFAFFSLIVTFVVVIRYFVSVSGSYTYAHIMSALIFTLLSSALLLVPNYYAAINFRPGLSKIHTLLLTLFNHFLFVVPIFILVYYALKYIVSEFRQ
ncbi:hypothetical protein [Litchfieldia alkalitelluris]|uniref:hypothetical protein n=1 Tax=Litchfieldia alkalitelluris TaxID=304268 RepID=UPI000B45113B|nr:hypothetical protein [Litchfieldia alkalitelluris]